MGDRLGVDDFAGVIVEAARRLVKELLPRRVGFKGDDCGVAIRRFAIDAVNDCVLTFSIGATEGAEYISGIFGTGGTGGAFTGVENVLDV